MKCCPYVVPFLLKKPLSIDFRGFQLRTGDPAGIRTQDHYIKSVMLYQLSYGIVPTFFQKRVQM